MKVFSLFGRVRGYNRGMLRIQEIGDHPQREEIERRLKAVWLAERGRIEEVQVLFGVSRSTVFNWKKRLRDSSGDVHSLAPGSRAPCKRRRRQVDARLVEFVRKYRISRPGIGKTAIWAELNRFCKERDLPAISESTVGRLLSDLRAAGRIPGRGLYYKVIGYSGRLVQKQRKKPKKKRRRNGYQPQNPGDLVQIDSVAFFREGVKRYLLTAVDLVTRVAFSFCYPTLNSRNAKDFLSKLLQVVPFMIRFIQTDNGCEFEKDFAIAIRDSPIQHFHNYPRHPQSNAHVERFNRTLRSQFLEAYEEDIKDTRLLNQHLVEYLLWYNIRKPHQGIGNLSPLEYYMKRTHPERLQSNMSWTPTSGCLEPAAGSIITAERDYSGGDR